jgi:hypothetical protein
MLQGDDVSIHSWLLQTIKLVLLMVFTSRGLDRMFVHCTPSKTHRGCYINLMFSGQVQSEECWRLSTLGCLPIFMLYLDRALLMQLKVAWTKGRKITELESFTWSGLLQWIKNMMNLPHTKAIFTEVSLNLIQFCLETVLVIDGFCCECQGGLHTWLFNTWWSNLAFKYRLVHTSFLYSLWPKEPSGLL